MSLPRRPAVAEPPKVGVVRSCVAGTRAPSDSSLGKEELPDSCHTSGFTFSLDPCEEEERIVFETLAT